jgi:hypothetical protein
MKKYLLILVFLSNGFLFAQKLTPKIYIKVNHDKVMFYQEFPKTLLISVKDATDGYMSYFLSNINSSSLVSNCTKLNKDQKIYYSVEFKNPLNIASTKQFFNDIHATVFYTNMNNKVYVKDILSDEEILAKKNTPLQNFQATDKCSNPNNIEYYNYNIFNIEAKAHSMFVNNYPMYLMNGSVASFDDKMQEAMEARSNFINRK